jgi:hypothetical protein
MALKLRGHSLSRRLPTLNDSRLTGRVAASRKSPIGKDCPQLYFGLFCQFQGVVYFDTTVSDRAFKLRMAEQQLNCSQIFGLLVNQGCFGSTQ